MKFAYPRIASRLFGRPLAIDPPALGTILDRIGHRIVFGLGPKMMEDDEEGEPIIVPSRTATLAATIGGQHVRVNDGMGEYCLTPGGVAVISAIGPLSQRYDFFTAICGFATYDGIRCSFDAAVIDPKVKAILFDMDTPGGEAAGMFDLADHIRENRDEKPIWACANALAASAGYGIAGSAERFTLPRMAYVGSIGVVVVHCDVSERDKEEGVKYTAVYSGARKIDGWEHMPLSETAQALIQKDIDVARGMFAALVDSQGRISKEDVLKTEADVYRDNDATKIGLADDVLSFEETLEELEMAVNRPSNGAPIATMGSKKGVPSMKIKGSKKGKMAGAASATATENEEDPRDRPDYVPKNVPEEEPVDQPEPGEDTGESEEENEDDGERPSRRRRRKTDEPEENAEAKSARAETNRVTEIVELCQLAGKPHMAAAMIRNKDCTVADARAKLMKARADTGGREDDLSTSRSSAPGQPARDHGWGAIHEKTAKKMGIPARP